LIEIIATSTTAGGLAATGLFVLSRARHMRLVMMRAYQVESPLPRTMMRTQT